MKPRKSKAVTKSLPLNFLLGCSQAALGTFELARLAEVADLRKQLHLILDRVIDQMSQAALVSWFKVQDRQSLKHAIENEESATEWAKRMIREGQRSGEELLPLPVMSPDLVRASHLTANIRYKKKITLLAFVRAARSRLTSIASSSAPSTSQKNAAGTSVNAARMMTLPDQSTISIRMPRATTGAS